MRVFARGKMFVLILTLALALPLVAFADANDDSLVALEKVIVTAEKISKQAAVSNSDLEEFNKVTQEFQQAAVAVDPQTMNDVQKQTYMAHMTRLQKAVEIMMGKANAPQGAPAK